MSQSLEERAASARASIDEVTVSAADREFEPPGRGVGSIAALVLVAVLTAAGALALTRGGEVSTDTDAASDVDAVSASDDTATSVPSEPTDVAVGDYLVFDPAPDEFKPMIFNQPQIREVDVPTFDIYGSPGDDPFADGDLLLASLQLDADEPLVDPDTPNVEIGGVTIWLEDDELDGDQGFVVVSHFDGGQATALMSQATAQPELAQRLADYIVTGELNTGGLVLLVEDSKTNLPQFSGPGAVIYQWTDDGGEIGRQLSDGISAVVIHSNPFSNDLLVTWFARAASSGVDGPPPLPQVVQHQGRDIEVRVGVESSLELRFEIDGVPVQVTVMNANVDTTPPLDEALRFTEGIRVATAAEIDEMTELGDSFAD